MSSDSISEDVTEIICNRNEKKDCTIRLGKVFCDGYNDTGLIGCFTHFHEDHIGAVADCIGKYDTIITHPLTLEALTALDSGLRYREQWVTQDYGIDFVSKVGKIRLLKANHIPGSAQIHVEKEDATMLYSGDFNYPEVQILKADYLVLDASHGALDYNYTTDRKSIKDRMYEELKEKLDSDEPVVIIAHSGTLQEIIKHFEIGYVGSKITHDIPFVTTVPQKKILEKLYKNEIKEFRDILTTEDRDYLKLLQKQKKCVIFLTPNDSREYPINNYHTFRIDHYRFNEKTGPIIVGDRLIRFNLSAHASIKDIIAYVEDVNPKEIILDNSRSLYAPSLAKIIKMKFGDKISIKVQPKNN